MHLFVDALDDLGMRLGWFAICAVEHELNLPVLVVDHALSNIAGDRDLRLHRKPIADQFTHA